MAAITPDVAATRDHGAAWSEVGTIQLTSPPGETWTAQIDLSLLWKDGTRVGWTEPVAVDAVTLDHRVTEPAAARARGGLALLVAYVRYEAADGRRQPPVGTGGRFVEVTATGLTATARRFGALEGVGLIHDLNDEAGYEPDPEVVR